jgi:hypothetical protein
MQPFQEGHACHPDDRATAAVLRSTTKPCPGCHTSIQKSEGCHQMMCTACNTVFDWATGAKVTSGPLHNPYYFMLGQEERARIRERQGMADAGGCVQLSQPGLETRVETAARAAADAIPEEELAPYTEGILKGTVKEKFVKRVMTVYRTAVHNFAVVLPEVQRDADRIDPERYNRMSRIHYLLGRTLVGLTRKEDSVRKEIKPPIELFVVKPIEKYNRAKYMTTVMATATQHDNLQHAVGLMTTYCDVMRDMFAEMIAWPDRAVDILPQMQKTHSSMHKRIAPKWPSVR